MPELACSWARRRSSLRTLFFAQKRLALPRAAMMSQGIDRDRPGLAAGQCRSRPRRSRRLSRSRAAWRNLVTRAAEDPSVWGNRAHPD